MFRFLLRVLKGISIVKVNDDVSVEFYGLRYFIVVEGLIGLLDGGVRFWEFISNKIVGK